VAGDAQAQTFHGKTTPSSPTTRSQSLSFLLVRSFWLGIGDHCLICSIQELEPPLSTPKPLSDDETERVNYYISFRHKLRNGPFYAVLEKNSFTDEKGRLNRRTGFDPFTGMEKYSARFEKPKRTVPDLSARSYRT
jgi:hypothetical protein